nr:hypothetical protein Iba_chr03bCG6230 [Ipomoea batatas]
MQQQTPLKSITSNSTFSYGTTSGVESSSKMKITTLSDIFSKREADELKAMQPSVMTKVPKDIRNLKGKGPSRLSNDLTLQKPDTVAGYLLDSQYESRTRAPLQDIPATLNMNRERDSSFQTTSSTITIAMMSSTMEFRNLNNDFEEAMEEQDLTNNESIG